MFKATSLLLLSSAVLASADPAPVEADPLLSSRSRRSKSYTKSLKSLYLSNITDVGVCTGQGEKNLPIEDGDSFYIKDSSGTKQNIILGSGSGDTTNDDGWFGYIADGAARFTSDEKTVCRDYAGVNPGDGGDGYDNLDGEVTSNEECRDICAGRDDCTGYEVRPSVPTRCEIWKISPITVDTSQHNVCFIRQEVCPEGSVVIGNKDIDAATGLGSDQASEGNYVKLYFKSKRGKKRSKRSKRSRRGGRRHSPEEDEADFEEEGKEDWGEEGDDDWGEVEIEEEEK